MMNNNAIYEFAGQSIRECPVCHQTKPIGHVDFLEEQGSKYLLRATCQHCGSGMLVKIKVMPNGLFGNVLVTDLEAREVTRFRGQRAVTVDHALGAHALSKEDWKRFINS